MKTRILILSVSALVAVTSFFGCRQTGQKQVPDILRANVDTTVSPGKDFFQYANGTWLKNNSIPASESHWGIGNMVQEETYARLKEISENAAKENKAEAGTALQKIGDFYASAMDTVSIEKNGIKPLQPELDKINAISDIKGLLDEIANLTPISNVFFGLAVSQDSKNSGKMAVYAWQAGIGLPDRDYYFNTDARTVNIRKEYVQHVTRMMQLLGEDEPTAKKHTDMIMKIETGLASKSRKLEALRDPYLNYNKMSVDVMSKLTPSINWKEILVKIGVKNPDTLIVGQPEFLKEVESILKTTGPEEWKAYLRWHLIENSAEYLSKAFELEDFHFSGTVMSGSKEQRVRWKRALDAEEGAIGELLGQLYVQKYFSPSTKKRYETMVGNIMEAYGERIKALDWMSPVTKEKALAKLSAVVKKVGYPEKWKDYSALTINRDSYVNNVLQARRWAFNYELNKLGKPVDRMEWGMTPQTYNAYYNPSNNEIVLPAAMFIIPGVPDSLADDAMMYAYVGGSTIGHEITHGFDDEGRQFDAKGNLADWWTKEDVEKFNSRTKLMVEQFNGYVVLDSMHVNGQACLGENIADLAGVILGYQAFQKTEQAMKGEKIAGFTPNQRYFLGYALSWLGHQRDERLARQIMTDVHAPAKQRVNGPLSDIPEFYEAFNIKPGDAMYLPENKRVKIW
jgi:putative endopeptidase